MTNQNPKPKQLTTNGKEKPTIKISNRRAFIVSGRLHDEQGKLGQVLHKSRSGDSFEWYGEWTQLRDSVLTFLDCLPSTSSDDGPPPQPQILVPGCGNSRLSENLYDAGFRAVTNIDFSKVVVSDMLRRNVRNRPEMKWRLMDMTNTLFADETFDVVLDKGGLDALMEPELGPKLGNQYLLEVKRVLKSGGRFICLTLAESHVVGLLFSKF